MKEFWNQSWDHVDMNRVSKYIEHMNSTEWLSDPIIDYLKKQQAKELLLSGNIEYGDFRARDIMATGFDENQFDAVVSRDVVDHMSLMNGIAAIRELYRIVKKDGSIIITLDRIDAEYETEPHIINSDGDYLFTGGKWDGMVFHPYSESEISKLVQVGTVAALESAADGLQVVIVK